MTPEQLENLEWLINDPDWDVSQRNDAWELLKALREELEWAEKDRTQLQSNNDAWILRFNALSALRSPAPAATVTDDWAVNAMKRIDGLPKPARESWSVLSWEEYYKECARIIQACYPPTETATVTGWRLLEVGEVIQEGDCVWNDEQSEWYPCVASVGKNNSGKYPIRRRLSQPAPTDAGRAGKK